MQPGSLTPFLAPQGVAVIGASHDPTKLGYGLARNLVQSGYTGGVHFVNPRRGSLLGHPVYASVAEAPDPVDLAVILTPPPTVPQALEECGQRGIRAAIIASGGFREVGSEGAALEARCVEIARRYGMRIVGPNCIGVIDTHFPLDTTFLQPPGPARGEIAFLSHSGAICAAVIDWLRGQGLGLSSLVSLGNQADVNETDMLAEVAADPDTRVITLYLEGISQGRHFVEEARRITRQKPILALKVGRFESGRRAAASHTGALAGSESGFDAAFLQSGVIRAGTIEEMFLWARALAWCPLPHGTHVAVLTNAGGPGVAASDALEQQGLQLASLSAETISTLQEILPPAASLHNPIDMLASASPEQYARCLKALLEDPGVDSILVIAPPPPMFSAGGVAKAIIPVIQAGEKPVIVTLMGDRLVQEGVEFLRAARIPEYRFPEAAASALAVLARRAQDLDCPEEALLCSTDVDIPRVKSILSNCRPGEFLSQEAALGLMEAYGIPTLQLRLAATPEEAARLAIQEGFPVALKVASPDILHKSDVGGVLLDLGDAAAVSQGFDAVIRAARERRPEARIEGVLVQRMLTSGQDVIAGVVSDPQFGPVAMFGSGGVEVEGLHDVAFALAPLYPRDAERLLDKTWAGRKLQGYRNLPPADRTATRLALAHLAQLAADFPELAEIEINPLRVLPEGQGAFALDVRARLKK
ncbi:MAG: acetate--CoA ligase family protein [Chloroflexi bacterium]|nr:acetate--CoA ligase family protein [Chloroflexota bacterium]